MQRAIFFLFLTILSVLNFCCSSSEALPPQSSPATKKFSAYLKANFDDSIPAENHLYFLITKKEKRENTLVILARLKEEMKNIPKQHYTMIFSVNVPVPDSLIPKGNSHTDWDGAIENLELNLGGVSIIQTADGQVMDMLRLDKDVFGMEMKVLKW
jgi:hypothetical protein